MLRIVPGKCSGEPHVSGSRVTTRSIAALWERGYGVDAIAVLYPHEDREALVQALELETQLSARRAA